MHDIAIVGAGIGGLHLGLSLLQHGITPTLYARQDAEQMRQAPLSNTVVLFDTVRRKTKELGIPCSDTGGITTELEFGIKGMPQFGYRAPANPPFQFLDMRIYLADALEVFRERGGRVVTSGALDAEAVRTLGQRHDLVVVASGRGALSELFERVPERSPFSEPQRHVFAGLFRGIQATDPPRFSHQVVPEHGEISEFPFSTFEGEVRALLILAVPGGSMDVLTQFRHQDDLPAFEAKVLDVLREHAPSIFDRVVPDRFESLGSHHLVQGAVLPVVRRGVAKLDNGRWALALGDAHVTIDPLIAQGANIAAKGAHLLAGLLSKRVSGGLPFDSEFCAQVEDRLWTSVQPASDWGIAALSPPQPQMFQLAEAVATSPVLAEQIVKNFDEPARHWETIRSAENTAAFIQTYLGS